MITLAQLPYLVVGQAVWRYDPTIGTITKHVISEITTLHGGNDGSPMLDVAIIVGYIIILDDTAENSMMIMDPLYGDSLGNIYCYLFEYEVPKGTSEVDLLVDDLFTRPMKRG